MPKHFEKNSKKDLLKGVFYMLLAFFCFGAANALVKTTSGEYSILQILSLRNLTLLVLIVPYIFFFQKTCSPLNVLRTPNLKSHILRGFLVVISLWGLFVGFKFLPLANAHALGFSEILFMTIVSIPFLKEKVNPSQWAAIIVGFLGVLIVARPDFSVFNITELATIFLICGALLDGIVLLYPRKLGKTDSVLTILFYYALFSTLISFSFLPLEGWNPIASQQDFIFLIGLGVLSLFGQLFATQAFQYAPAGVLSPMIYSILLWAILFGYIFWAEIPDIYTVVGSIIVIGSGLYIIWKSHTQVELIEKIGEGPEGDFGRNPRG